MDSLTMISLNMAKPSPTQYSSSRTPFESTHAVPSGNQHRPFLPVAQKMSPVTRSRARNQSLGPWNVYRVQPHNASTSADNFEMALQERRTLRLGSGLGRTVILIPYAEKVAKNTWDVIMDVSCKRITLGQFPEYSFRSLRIMVDPERRSSELTFQVRSGFQNTAISHIYASWDPELLAKWRVVSLFDGTWLDARMDASPTRDSGGPLDMEYQPEAVEERERRAKLISHHNPYGYDKRSVIERMLA